MKNKFNFDTATKLSLALNSCATDIQIKNEDMRNRYVSLNESFRDPVYNEYQAEFATCDKSIKDACDLLNELGAAILKYADTLRESY